jgi:hypothetical protein
MAPLVLAGMIAGKSIYLRNIILAPDIDEIKNLGSDSIALANHFSIGTDKNNSLFIP